MITKVMLRDRKNQRYYAGPGEWVPDPGAAKDFGGIIQAARAFTEEDLAFADIVIDNGELPAAPPRVLPLPTDPSHRLRRPSS